MCALILTANCSNLTHLFDAPAFPPSMTSTMRVSELLILKFHILLKIELNEAGLPNRPQAEVPQMTATMDDTAAVLRNYLAPAMRKILEGARENMSHSKVRVRIVIKLHSTRNAS
jgi:hypothetical protein